MTSAINLKLEGEALQAQREILSRFVRQQGYLRVENSGGIKTVKLVERPGFFASFAHLIYKPESERYETVCTTLFEFMEANPELAQDAHRLSPFISKNPSHFSRLRRIISGKPHLAALRQEARDKKGDYWIQCASGKRVSAHISVIQSVDWFRICLEQHKRRNLGESSIDLTAFEAVQVEAFLDCIYDGHLHNHLSQEDTFQVYRLMDYTRYPHPEVLPSFYEDITNCDQEKKKALIALLKQQLHKEIGPQRGHYPKPTSLQIPPVGAS